MTAQELVSKGFGGYQGWGDNEADADFRATGGAGKFTGTKQESGTAPSPEDYTKAILDAQQKQIAEATKFLDQYVNDNPFVFDEEYARQQSKAEFDPYYHTLLDEYTRGVELKRTNIQDESKLLQDLYKLDTGTRSRAYDKAVRSAEEGFAGQGMFFSGVRKRDTGEKQVEYLNSEDRAGTVYGAQQAGLGRQQQGLSLEEEIQNRELGAQQSEAVTGGIETRRKEAETQYYLPLEQAYARRFPTTSGNLLAGYVPPEYLRY